MSMQEETEYRRKRRANQKGFALIESLFSIALFAVLGLAFTQSVIVGFKMRHRMIHRATALQIASDEMERQSRIRATSLTAGTTTTTVTKNAMQFQRVVTITAVNAGGFDITVAVSDLSSQVSGTVQLQNTLIPYGST